MSKLIEVPFVSKDTEYELTVEVEDGKPIDIVEVFKLIPGDMIMESPKRFKKRLNKSDWKAIEENLRFAT